VAVDPPTTVLDEADELPSWPVSCVVPLIDVNACVKKSVGDTPSAAAGNGTAIFPANESLQSASIS
jgi:hypothetical protein